MTLTGTAAGLLLATLAFALAFMPPPTRWRAAGVATATLLAIAIADPAISEQVALTGCWVMLTAVAVVVYAPAVATHRPLLPMSGALAVGALAGVLLAPGGLGLVAASGLVFAGLLMVASLVAHRGWGLALRVVTSWAVAVAILVGTMPYFVAHPGYVPDHRE